MTVQLSVIIPTLDEAAALPGLLEDLRAQQGVTLQLIVADGGSTDATVALAQAAGATVVQAPRGRGAQMNAGARAASAPMLLFLHADSRLQGPTQLADALAAVTGSGAHSAGHFALSFARRQPGHELFYRYVEGKTSLHRPGTINGDQGLLLGAELFAELGGFDESLPFLEDQRLAQRIFERGVWLLLPGKLTTSARRFEVEGAYRRYTLMALIMGMHAAGADEFFARARDVYRAQGDTQPLDMRAFLRVLRQTLIAAGPRRALTILWRAGRYSRQNAWQLFYWWDIALGTREYPALRFHDRVLAPLTNNVIFDALGTVLMALWYLLVLPVGYAVLAITGDRAG